MDDGENAYICVVFRSKMYGSGISKWYVGWKFEVGKKELFHLEREINDFFTYLFTFMFKNSLYLHRFSTQDLIDINLLTYKLRNL